MSHACTNTVLWTCPPLICVFIYLFICLGRTTPCGGFLCLIWTIFVSVLQGTWCRQNLKPSSSFKLDIGKLLCEWPMRAQIRSHEWRFFGSRISSAQLLRCRDVSAEHYDVTSNELCPREVVPLTVNPTFARDDPPGFLWITLHAPGEVNHPGRERYTLKQYTLFETIDRHVSLAERPRPEGPETVHGQQTVAGRRAKQGGRLRLQAETAGRRRGWGVQAWPPTDARRPHDVLQRDGRRQVLPHLRGDPGPTFPLHAGRRATVHPGQGGGLEEEEEGQQQGGVAPFRGLAPGLPGPAEHQPLHGGSLGEARGNALGIPRPQRLFRIPRPQRLSEFRAHNDSSEFRAHNDSSEFRARTDASEFRGPNDSSEIRGSRDGSSFACALVGRKMPDGYPESGAVTAASPGCESASQGTSTPSCCGSSVFGSPLEVAGRCGCAGGDGVDMSDRLLSAINLTRLLAAVR